MREMRRNDRMITDREEIVDVLDSCKVFRMAVHDEEGMYIVPLKFGYTYEEDVLKLYFHSAGEGRKVDALAADPMVAIEMDTDHYLVEGPNACSFGYLYSSIVGNGIARKLTEPEEKCAALNCLMNHQLTRNTDNMRSFDKIEKKKYNYSDQMLAVVNVYEIVVESFTCKSRR